MRFSAGSTGGAPRADSRRFGCWNGILERLTLLLTRGRYALASVVTERGKGRLATWSTSWRAYKHSPVGSLGRPSFIEAVQAMLPSTARRNNFELWSRS